jgi:hypothetical protein
MRTRFLLVLAAAATLGVSPAMAQEAPASPPTTAPAAKPDVSTKATTCETVALGTLPPLAGRWMILNDLDLAGHLRVVPAFWQITEKDGKPVVVERFVALPLDLTKALEKENTAGEKWEPTDDELARLRTEWDDLPDQMRGVAHVKTELWGKDAFTDQIKKEDVDHAQWVVRQTYEFMPGGNRPVRQVNVFAADATTPRGFSGRYSGVAVAVAPFPIPIPYKGTFRMIRLDPAPATGFLARLAEMFKGCGR